jgi:hypothetical protein
VAPNGNTILRLWYKTYCGGKTQLQHVKVKIKVGVEETGMSTLALLSITVFEGGL